MYALSDRTETSHTEVVVVGGGQAGLTTGYYLTRAGIPFVILDAGTRPGEAWRRRWDTLKLFTPARYSSLPGLPFPGDPDHWPGKDEVADYLVDYAATFGLPLRHNAHVTALRRTAGGFRLDTTDGRYDAEQVIVATGAYQRPYVPPVAERLAAGVVQLHSAAYRNPGQLPPGTVLVVGAANSGVGIAEDLAATHQVVLSQGRRLPHLPRRVLGKPLHFWADRLGLISAPLDSWRGRTQRGELVVGPSLRRLARHHGIRLAARTTAATGHTVRFADGAEIDVDAVIWASGYRSDYRWIDAPVFDPHGGLRHRRGVTEVPGLYFLGMKHQHSRGSSLIHWVRHDAAHIVDRLAQTRAQLNPKAQTTTAAQPMAACA